MTEQEESAATGSGAATERAAGIEYTFVTRPADVPAEYEAPAGTSLRFLVVTAIDGSLVEAALWQPGDRPVNTTTLVIDVHGSGGTFHGPPNGFLARRWPPKAMACSASIPDSPARA